MELIDSYNHNDPTLIYITENIPTKETKDDFDSQFCHHCTCVEVCTVQTKCSCIEQFDCGYFKCDNETELDSVGSHYLLKEDFNLPIYECNSNCLCAGRNCGNRLVQYGPRKYLEIINCNEENTESSVKKAKTEEQISKGLGLKTNVLVKKGMFICEYAGEVITKRDACLRFKENKDRNHMNYIICVKEHTGENVLETYIDPKYFGNIGRYLNHCCEPNCKLVPVRVDSPIPKICIFALTDIEANSELTFDYGSENNEKELTEEDAFKLNLKKCLCNAKKCKKWLPFMPQLTE